MEFGDQSYRQTKPTKENPMNASNIVKKFLTFVTPTMHASRREALNACVLSIMNGKTRVSIWRYR